LHDFSSGWRTSGKRELRHILIVRKQSSSLSQALDDVVNTTWQTAFPQDLELFLHFRMGEKSGLGNGKRLKIKV
jgi:hypothetical protein